VLTNKGFEIEWDENVNTKILIQNFKWQYLYDNQRRDILDYDKVIEIMLNQ